MTAIRTEDLPTVYDAKETEESIYKFWEDGEFFKADAKSDKPPYSIVIPPPNVTGVLHMGHALDETLQDILTRYHRMSGYETLWLPGTDHAGIATQNVVEKKLREKGVSRYDLGREKFLEETWKWANEHKSAILDQCKRLGASFDRSRERFTFDEGCSEAVKEVFIKLYEKGLIYKGKYIVNWCPRCNSAISDVETEYATEQGHMWEISYPLKGEHGAIIVATTRPETIFGDVAIAVHPSDHKYSELIGKTVVIPLSGREIPIIADEYVDKNFGTGAVKITPAHDPNDFEVGKRHGLKPVWVIDTEGKMKACGEVPQSLHGLDRYEAREKIIGMLSYENFLLRTRDHEHNVGKCQRCGTTIEPLLSEQWFVKMEPLAKEAIAAVKDGRIKFVPDRWEKNYLGWMENIRDWCISRQRVWGVPIPIFYAEDETPIIDQNVINYVANLFEKYGSNVWFEREAKDLLPEGFTHPGSPNGKFTKENDIMDVWFDSGTSHHAALKLRYGVEQADVYLEGSDQYRGWFNSSLTTSVALTGKAPYKIVISHGFTLDGEGRKMSKSLGNTIDPIASCNEFGADIFRLWVASVEYQSDFKMSKELLKQVSEAYRKIRNTFRFLLGNLFDFDPISDAISYDKMTEIDQYMMCKLNEVVKNVHNAYNNYEFSEVFRTILNFMTNELSSFYLDFTKDILYIDDAQANSRRSIQTVLYETLKALTTLITPIIPHTAEEVYNYMPGTKEESIYLVDMYQPTLFKGSDELLSKYEDLMKVRDDILKALEEARSEKVIGKSLNANVIIYPTDKVAKLLTTVKVDFKQIFIVYKFTIAPNDFEGKVYSSGKIKIEPASGYTCSRCWQIVPSINPDELCPRCAEVVNKLKIKK